MEAAARDEACTLRSIKVPVLAALVSTTFGGVDTILACSGVAEATPVRAMEDSLSDMVPVLPLACAVDAGATATSLDLCSARAKEDLVLAIRVFALAFD